jgi:hypothetical protein
MMVTDEILWGKLVQEKYELLSQTSMKIIARQKHSSLVCPSVILEDKSFNRNISVSVKNYIHYLVTDVSD